MRFDGLDLNLLVALDALLETHSVTDASRRLNLSQPSMSAALKRLRDYFGDDLLVQVGRQMIPTAKAEALAPTIKEMLNLVRFRIAQTNEFDAESSHRTFRLLASDYVYDVLLAGVLAKSEKLAPAISFDIAQVGPEGVRQFINGDIDLMITAADYAIEGYPQSPLFSDADTVICWSGGRYAAGMTAGEFLAADHAIAVFGEERRPTVSDIHFGVVGIDRRAVVRVSSFSALPAAVVGTDRVAVMHRRHAKLFARLYPIVHHDLPIEGPGIVEIAQWHRLREKDPGVLWLMEMLSNEVAVLTD